MTSKSKSSRARASTTLARRHHNDAWVVLDLETTGLRPDAEPIEIALVSAAGELILESLIRPGCEIEPGASRLHGLDGAALAAAPSFSEVYPLLDRLLRGRQIVAYWASFDRSVLERTCRSHRLPAPRTQWICAHALYSAWRGFSASLSTACEIERIAPGVRHRAAADACLVWELLQRMPVMHPLFDN